MKKRRKAKREKYAFLEIIISGDVTFILFPQLSQSRIFTD